MNGFNVTGSGGLDVITAKLYTPGGSYLVSGVVTAADAQGRLHFHLDLGPSHQIQQYNFVPGGTSKWTHRTVSIGAAP